MLSRFPAFRRPLPLGRHETAASLLSRHAAQLGIPGAAAICTDLEIRWSDILSGDALLLTDLAKAARVAHTDLIAWSPVRTPDGVQIGRELLPKKTGSQGHTRFCPLCIRDDLALGPNRPDLAVFGRAEWHIPSLPVCEIHGVMLVEHPIGEAQQKQTDFTHWIRPVLPDLASWLRRAVVCRLSDCDGYLFARLRGDAGPIPLLDNLPLPIVTQACEALGRDFLPKQEGPIAIDDVPTLQAARHHGFRLLATGPDELWTYLDHRLEQVGPDNLSSLDLTTFYGGLYQWLRRQTNPSLNALRNLIADHAFANLPLAAGTSICRRVLPVRRRHTIRSAVAEFHSRTSMMRTWLIAEDVLTDAASPVATTMLPDTPAATAFLDTVRHAFTHRQASRFLKIDSDQLNELISERIVNPLFPSIADPVLNAYDRSELATLIERLWRGLSIDVPPRAAHVRYARSTKIASEVHCKFSEVVRLIAANPTVRTFRKPNESGLRALHISIEDVRTAIHKAPLPGLTPWRFTETLRISPLDLEQLQRLGLVWTKSVRHPALNAPFAIIPNACVTEFQSRYIDLHTLAIRRQRHWRADRKRLDARGIEPVYDGPTAKSQFYERTPLIERLMTLKPFRRV